MPEGEGESYKELGGGRQYLGSYLAEKIGGNDFPVVINNNKKEAKDEKNIGNETNLTNKLEAIVQKHKDFLGGLESIEKISQALKDDPTKISIVVNLVNQYVKTEPLQQRIEIIKLISFHGKGNPDLNDALVRVLITPEEKKQWLVDIIKKRPKTMDKLLNNYFGLREILEWGTNTVYNEQNVGILKRWAGVEDESRLNAILKLKSKLIDAIKENKPIALDVLGSKNSNDSTEMETNPVERLLESKKALIKNHDEVLVYLNRMKYETVDLMNNMSDIEFARIIDSISIEIEKTKTVTLDTLIINLDERLTYIEVQESKIRQILGEEKTDLYMQTAEQELAREAEKRGEQPINTNTIQAKEKVIARALQLAKEDKTLTQDQKQKIDKITVEYYQKTKEYINYDQVRSKEILSEVKASAYQTYEQNNESLPENTSFDRIKATTLNDPTIDLFFKQQDHQLAQDVFKDAPETDILLFNTRPIPEQYQKFFDPQGHIHQEQYSATSPEEQKMINDFYTKRLTTTKEVITQETNVIIKKQAVTMCIDSLKSLFNVQIQNQGEIESWLTSFKNMNEQSENILQNNQLTLKGDLNGKEIVLVYNLETGLLSTKQYLSQTTNGTKESDFIVNDPSAMKGLDSFRLPTLKDIVSSSQKINYTQLVQGTKGDMQGYTNQLEAEIYDQMASKLPTVDNKKSFEQAILQNIVAQEMCGMMGINKSQPRKISKDKQTVYTSYQYVYESLSEYSPDQLLLLRKNISEYKRLESIQLARPSGPENKEASLIQKLTQDKQKSGGDYQGDSFVDLFDLLKDEQQAKLQKHVIDLTKFSEMLERAQAIVPEYGKLPSSYTAKIDSIIAPMQADQELDKELNLAFA